MTVNGVSCYFWSMCLDEGEIKDRVTSRDEGGRPVWSLELSRSPEVRE